jgi:hypothetical protein
MLDRPVLVLVLVVMSVLLPLAVLIGAVSGVWGYLPGAAVFALFALVARDARARARDWYVPFLFLLVVPAITVPSQAIFLDLLTDGFPYNAALHGMEGGQTEAGRCTAIYDGRFDKEWQCPETEAALTLLPGVLNLAALLWLGSSKGRTRTSARVAGAAGALRLLAPAAIYLTGGPVVIIGSYQIYSGGTVYNITPWVSALLWLGTAAAMIAVGRATRGSGAAT